jgi:hypothetical protein
MVKSKDGKTEIISKEENYLRQALERTKDLIFQGEQNNLINKDMIEVLEKRLKNFKS